MSFLNSNHIADTGTADAHWRGLYRIGGVTALVAAVLFLSDIIVMTTGTAMITSASDWFTLMQNSKALGILELFFSDLIGLALLIPFIFALYALLRRDNEVYPALAAILVFMGMGMVFVINPNYSLLHLYNQYVNAATEIERTQILATGEMLFAAGMCGTGILTAGLFIEGAFVLLSTLMLRSSIFSKRIAYLGILGHGLDLCHSIVLLILIPIFNPNLASSISSPLLAIGGTFQLLWYPLMARRLLQLGRSGTNTISQQS